MQGAFPESSSTDCMNHVSRAPEAGMLGQWSDVLSQLDSYHNLHPPSAGRVLYSSSFPARQVGNGPDPEPYPSERRAGGFYQGCFETLKVVMWPAAAERVARTGEASEGPAASETLRSVPLEFPGAKFGKNTERKENHFSPWRASGRSIDISRTSGNPSERLLVPRFRDSL